MEKYEFFGATSVFMVKNLDEAIRFYVETLGFSLNSTYGDPPYHAQVSLGRLADGYIPITIQLIQRGEPVISDNYLYLRVGRHMQDLFARYRRAGVEVARALSDQPWGMTEFEIRDVNGYRLVFGGHTEDQGYSRAFEILCSRCSPATRPAGKLTMARRGFRGPLPFDPDQKL